MLRYTQEERGVILERVQRLSPQHSQLFVAMCCERWLPTMLAFRTAHNVLSPEQLPALIDSLWTIKRSDKQFRKVFGDYLDYVKQYEIAMWDEPNTFYAKMARSSIVIFIFAIEYGMHSGDDHMTKFLKQIDRALSDYIYHVTGIWMYGQKYWDSYLEWSQSFPRLYLEHRQQEEDLKQLEQLDISDEDAIARLHAGHRKRMWCINPIEEGWLPTDGMDPLVLG